MKNNPDIDENIDGELNTGCIVMLIINLLIVIGIVILLIRIL